MAPISIIERFSIVAPLGLCFHDAATGERVADGLEISHYPANSGIGKTKLRFFRTVTVFMFCKKSPDSKIFHTARAMMNFGKIIRLKNRISSKFPILNKRFQPFQFTLKLPVKGIYKWENIPPTSPNKNLESIPLYSAPTRKISGGMSVVRAQLREVVGDPASWAVLEARFNGILVARGIADRDGQIVLMFPSLSPQINPIISPPSNATRISLAEQNWNLDLTVKYQPNIFQTSPPI